jgi:hypothetical protein
MTLESGGYDEFRLESNFFSGPSYGKTNQEFSKCQALFLLIYRVTYTPIVVE